MQGFITLFSINDTYISLCTFQVAVEEALCNVSLELTEVTQQKYVYYFSYSTKLRQGKNIGKLYESMYLEGERVW